MAAGRRFEHRRRRGAARGRGRAAAAPRILLTTEGTYPYALGGVSSWCDLLWAGSTSSTGGAADHRAARARAAVRAARACARGGADRGLVGGAAARCRGRAWRLLPGVLVRGLLGWRGDTDAVLEEWLWCRRHPAGVRRAFVRRGVGGVPGRARGRARRARPGGRHAAAAGPGRGRAALPDAVLVARTAAVPTPAADVLHVTAAGWSAIPALVHRRCTARRWC